MTPEIETGATPTEITLTTATVAPSSDVNPASATPAPAAKPDPANPAPDSDESQLPPKVQALLEKLRGTEREYKQLKGTHDAAQKAAEAAQTAAQIEQGKYKELFEAEKSKRAAAENAAKSLERERLLDRVAAKHKLPETMRNRLQGEDEAALEVDALELAKLLIRAKLDAPDLDSQRRGSTSAAPAIKSRPRIL